MTQLFNDYGQPYVIGARKTWKHTLSPEKNAERIKQMRFCKKVRESLGSEFEVTFYFNPGGVAVWGETWVKIHWTAPIGVSATAVRVPVVEACLSHDFSYVRQWDGRHSGFNYATHYQAQRKEYDCVGKFVEAVRTLTSKPFVRF